jgi:hypothetical protein
MASSAPHSTGARATDMPLHHAVRGYRDDFFLKLMAAVQGGDAATLAAVLRRQRAHLLRELHIRADLGVLDAAEKALPAELSASTTPAGRAEQAGHAEPAAS